LIVSYNKGTWQFMAVEVLNGKLHEPKHDLESFYWLLTWILFRHTHHNQLKSKARTLFDILDKDSAANAKLAWLQQSIFRITGNEPLNSLLVNLRKCFRGQQSMDVDYESVDVTHDGLLTVIDDALRRTDWPRGDKATPFDPSSASRDRKALAKSITANSNPALPLESIRQILYPDLSPRSTQPTLDSNLPSGSTKPTLASNLASGSTKRRLSADVDKDVDPAPASIKRSKSNPVHASGKKPNRTSGRRAPQKK
jgi:hypothetical protein